MSYSMQHGMQCAQPGYSNALDRDSQSLLRT